MSLWGAHPKITRDEARDALRSVGVLAPCTDCLQHVVALGWVPRGFACGRCGAEAKFPDGK